MARPHRMSKPRKNCHHVGLACSYVHLFKWFPISPTVIFEQKLHTSLSHERPEAGKHVKFQVKKASSYIAQYPVHRTVQSALHFTSLTDLFTQTPSQLLWEAFSHMLQLMREDCSSTYPLLCIARYTAE